MMLILVHVVILYVGAVLGRPANPQYGAWLQEISQSLERNVKVNCSLEYLPGLSMPNNDKLLWSVFLPTNVEMQVFQRLPDTLTQANAATLPAAISKRYGYDHWASNTQIRWEIPAEHPGQNRSNCFDITALAAEERTLNLYQPYKSVHRTFYIIRGKHAVIHPDGSVGFKCGYFMGQEGCETRWNRAQDWWRKCNAHMSSNGGLSWDSLWSGASSDQQAAMTAIENCTYNQALAARGLNMTALFTPRRYKRVFTIAALGDFNYHHFIADSLARLGRNLKFLLANPDVHIHIRAFEEYDIDPVRDVKWKNHTRTMRDRLFTLLGIDLSRIVHGTVVAEEVFIPRNMHCSYALSNPMEMRLLAREIIKAANRDLATRGLSPIAQGAAKQNGLIVQQRYTTYGSSDRFWHDETAAEVMRQFQQVFSKHDAVILSSDSAKKDDHCLSCEIQQYASATVLVGAHGAGLTNMMFMPPGSLIVEIVGDFKDVNMPICGYYGPLAAVMGHHHYLHAYEHSTVNGTVGWDQRMELGQAAQRAFAFYNKVQTSNSSSSSNMMSVGASRRDRRSRQDRETV